MKEFSCSCGSKKFVLVQTSGTLVDFSQEGAIEGHPRLNTIGTDSYLFKCDSCGVTVPYGQAREMRSEVI